MSALFLQEEEKIKIPPTTYQIDLKKSNLPLDIEVLRKYAGMKKFHKFQIEIGFGNGEFLISKAKENPNDIFMGFELSGICIEKLKSRIFRENLRNIFYVREDAFFGFYFLLPNSSVDLVYINFPDPWPKKRHETNRLTTKDKLSVFFSKMKKGGMIIIKTDDKAFRDFTVEQSEDMFQVETSAENPKTGFSKYMRKWIQQGKQIYTIYLKKEFEKEVTLPRLPKPKMFLKMKTKKLNLIPKENFGFHLMEGIFVKFFKIYKRDNITLVETLINEFGYEQRFFLEIVEIDNQYTVDISPSSAVIRTEGIESLIKHIAGHPSDLIEPN